MPLLLASLATIGLALYPFAEARWFRLSKKRVAVGREVPALEILHLSDMHMTSDKTELVRFLERVARKVGEVDLVLVTGDLLQDNTGIEPVTEALNAFRARLGRFYVLGSHDYYQTRFQSFLKYFSAPMRKELKAPAADTERLESRLRDEGWIALTNTTSHVSTPVGTIRLSGVDDPYIDRHQLGHITRGKDEILAIGLAHAPDVVSPWMLNGFDLVVAGHTHGGQVRVPGVGALVTNSDLPASLAAGLHRIGGGWLHVSPGLGTGKFAPIRFACRPEATLLHVTS